MSDEHNVWELRDPGGTSVARFVPEADSDGHIHVTLYPTAHTGQDAHDPVVAAIRDKLAEVGLGDAEIVWSEIQWPAQLED